MALSAGLLKYRSKAQDHMSNANDMTPTETVEWVCNHFATAECLEDLETRGQLLVADKADKQAYTLLPGALDRMRGVYAKRLAELRSTVDSNSPAS